MLSEGRRPRLRCLRRGEVPIPRQLRNQFHAEFINKARHRLPSKDLCRTFQPRVRLCRCPENGRFSCGRGSGVQNPVTLHHDSGGIAIRWNDGTESAR